MNAIRCWICSSYKLSPKAQAAKDDDELGPSDESRDVETLGEEHVAYRIGLI